LNSLKRVIDIRDSNLEKLSQYNSKPILDANKDSKPQAENGVIKTYVSASSVSPQKSISNNGSTIDESLLE
jgi:hypothetical protein